MKLSSQNEKETLRERSIRLNLTDYEVESLFRTAASHDTTIEEILEDFIGNLVEGYHRRGSDEARLAEEYFERVIYSFDDDESYLQWLANYGNLEELSRFEIIEEESGDDEDSRDEIEYQKQKIEESFEEYLSHIGEERANNTNREEEIQRVKDFIQSRRSIRG